MSTIDITEHDEWVHDGRGAFSPDAVVRDLESAADLRKLIPLSLYLSLSLSLSRKILPGIRTRYEVWGFNWVHDSRGAFAPDAVIRDLEGAERREVAQRRCQLEAHLPRDYKSSLTAS